MWLSSSGKQGISLCIFQGYTFRGWAGISIHKVASEPVLLITIPQIAFVLLLFILLYFLILTQGYFFHCFFEREKGERKGKRESEMWERSLGVTEKPWLVASRMHQDQGLFPQFRNLSWPGIEPATFWLWDNAKPTDPHLLGLPPIAFKSPDQLPQFLATMCL